MARRKSTTRWAVVRDDFDHAERGAHRWWVCLKSRVFLAVVWPRAFAKLGPFKTSKLAEMARARLDKRDGK